MKKCFRCGNSKDKSEFYSNKSRPDLLNSECKECCKQTRKQYHKDGKYKIAYKSWIKKNPHYAWAKGTIQAHKKRGYKISLTVKELSTLAKHTATCKLCDCELKWNQGMGDGKLKKNSPTLDRIDNENYLNIKNTQIICHRCNSIKNSMSMIELIAFCKMIVNKYNTDILKEATL